MNSRRGPAHPPPLERVDAPVIVFVTVCTARRQPLLANADAHAVLRSAWMAAGAWLIGRYVVMPDHVHLFCAPRRDVGLVRWVQFWKAMSTRHWPDPGARPLWQRDFWDTQLRSATSYEEKLDYVRWNPVRRGLVPHPDAWPYQGHLVDLDWI